VDNILQQRAAESKQTQSAKLFEAPKPRPAVGAGFNVQQLILPLLIAGGLSVAFLARP
jgi:hypothetical protein